MRANCYGYAYRFDYFGATLPDEQDYIPYNFYKQQPGEFANKASGGIEIYDYDTGGLVSTVENYGELNTLLMQSIWSYDEDLNTKMDVLVQLMQADAATLGYTLTSCPVANVANSQPSSTKRLIAVVVGRTDYHFYMQHNNGTWSHKPGTNVPRNYCFCSTEPVTLMNGNIAEHACEGSYSNGIVRFFYITKNAVIDYSHVSGHYPSCARTALFSTDRAGNDFQTSKNLGSVSTISGNGVIDYCDDVDYYYFKPTSTKTYTFTSTTSSSLPITVVLYDANGSVLQTKTSNTGSVNFTYQLQSGTKYFIRISTNNQTTHQTGRTYNFYMS